MRGGPDGRADDERDSDGAAANGSGDEDLRAALADLPEQIRRCVVLRLDQALSYREIAAEMGLKIETVKVHLFQARRKLEAMGHQIDL